MMTGKTIKGMSRTKPDPLRVACNMKREGL